MEKSFKTIQLLNTVVSAKENSTSIILENGKIQTNKAVKALIKRLVVEDKSAKIAELKVNKQLYYFLEEVDNYIFLVRQLGSGDNILKTRVELNEEDKKLINRDDFRTSIQLLVKKVEYEEKRFGI